MDLMRLFVNQRDAEEAAYHSSHAWCRYHRPEAEPQVKTLLLPSYPIQSNAGSSYGFIAHGSLFWVRSLTPTILATGKNRFHQDSYVVVTEGVIGGTGNRNSRRGTEVPVGRVFLGGEQARSMALQTCHNLMTQLNKDHLRPISTSIVSLPIGKPSEYSSGEFLKEWPPQVLQPNLLQTSDNNENKRGALNYSHESPNSGDLGGTMKQQSYQQTSSTSMVSMISDDDDHPGVEVDCPFELPAAKRRRRFHHSSEATASTSVFGRGLSINPQSGLSSSAPNLVPNEEDQDDAMMSYGVVGEQF